jgi:hypothetical protein
MFRFTVRELVLVTAIVALAIAWWLDRSTIAAARDQAFLDCRTLANYTTPSGGYPMNEETQRTLGPIYSKYCDWPFAPEAVRALDKKSN